MTPESPKGGPCFRSILMVDIVSSTALYEQLGNVTARRQVGDRLAELSRFVEEHEGKVVKSLGDGLLCSFHVHEKAILAAIGMCDSGAGGLQVRVGVCCGEVVEEAGDVFGDAVNTAARIAALAKPSEILISHDVRESLPHYMKGIARRVPALSVKGKQEPLEVYAILEKDTRPRSPAQTVTSDDYPRAGITRLELSYLLEKLLLPQGKELSLGRGEECDLVVTGRHVSRLHARVFHRHGKFVLVDQSANGTYLVPRDQPMLHLLREEAILHDSGRIYLGADPGVAESDPIRYRTR